MKLGTKNKWVEALRSGKYPVGSGQLRSEFGYCAFGVLADFIDPNGWQPHPLHGYTWHDEVFKVDSETRKLCKMKTLFGEIVTDDNQRIVLSDLIVDNFEMIIPLIDKYYEQI